MINRMAEAKHPLVAADRSYTLADLVGEGLEAQMVIRPGQRAGDRVTRSSLSIPALSRIRQSLHRIGAPANAHSLRMGSIHFVIASMVATPIVLSPAISGKVIAVDRGQEKQRTHAGVQGFLR